jgi:UDP:flavonoid glycosyltransferase YjiC (YdhE family)
MRITLYAIGTRGDVQPMLALANGLRAAGHELTFVAGSNFEPYVTAHDMHFLPSLDIQALMQSPEGIAWVEEKSPIRQLGHMRRLLNLHADEMIDSLLDTADDADVLIGGFVSEPFAISLSEHFRKPVITAALQPYRPTRSAAASLIAPFRLNGPHNRWLGLLGQRMLWRVAADTVQLLRARLGLPPQSARAFIARQNTTPVVFGFSPTVTPQPNDWPEHLRVAGYWFLDEDPDWRPPAALEQFLAEGPAPVYVGFGSMTGSDPVQTFEIIHRALKASGQRGVISTGWSGADADAASDADAFVLEGAPHAWLFPRMAAVVHHGGAGTTAAGLRAGKPTLIIPHLGDQPYWGRRVHELGVGAKPRVRHTLSESALASGIRQITTDPSMQAKADALGARIRSEDGIGAAVSLIEEWARRPR